MERRFRLRREAEVRQVRARGRAYADGPLVGRVLPNAIDPPTNRYAVVAGKKAGGAVQRNRLKRLVREVLRHLHPTLAQGHDVVIVVRGTTEEMPGYAAARSSLERIVRRAGLLRPGAVQAPAVPSATASSAAGAEAAARVGRVQPEPEAPT